MPYDPKIGPGNPFLVDEAKGLVYQIDSQGKRFYYNPRSVTPAMLAESEAGLPHSQENIDAAERQQKQLLGDKTGGFWRGRGEWNSEKGQYDAPFNWGNLMALGVGGAIAAPAIAGALGGAAGGGAASGGVGIGETAATGVGGLTATSLGLPVTAGLGTAGVTSAAAGTGGLLASSPWSGAGTLPAGAPSGAMSGGGMNWLGLAQKVFDYKNPKSYLDLAQDVGERLGQTAAGRAQGRAMEEQAQMARARLLLGQADFNRASQAARGRNAAYGDILAGLQPVVFSGEGRNIRSTGGLSPALISPETRQLGAEMRRRALMSQMGQGGPNDPYTMNINETLPMPEESGLEKGMGWAGLASQLLSAIPRGSR